MQSHIIWFNQVLKVAIQLYFQQGCEYKSIEDIEPPSDEWLEDVVEQNNISFEESFVIMLALMPHISPQNLDIFFAQNKNFGRQYTEFGGWKGLSHAGFLPTGETAAFVLAGEDIEKRKKIARLFSKDHWFYKQYILRLEGANEGEPFLSGQLRVTDEFLGKILFDTEYKPDYSVGFPAKRITTELQWADIVLDYRVATELDEINTWIYEGNAIMQRWGLSKFMKAGYRALFYGPPGTGKTLAATLLGKKNNMDVYRVDLSMIVSKYIGETEKNLAKVFDMAENRNWILFFDEADALFGKRTSTNTSNDRYANQEVAYLLQRIEDFPGMIILATNLKSNIDEAFSRRFQSVIYFPMPTEELRRELWQNMLPKEWLGNNAEQLLNIAAETELSGGSIINVVRRCALKMARYGITNLDERILKESISAENLKK